MVPTKKIEPLRDPTDVGANPICIGENTTYTHKGEGGPKDWTLDSWVRTGLSNTRLLLSSFFLNGLFFRYIV